MATISYILGSPKRDKSRGISIILSHKGQRKRIPTNIIITHDNISKRGNIKSPDILKTLNDRMESLREKLCTLEESSAICDKDIEWLYFQLMSVRENLDFFEYAEQWISKSNNKGKGNYRVMLNSLERFHHSRKLPFCLIDYRFLTDYKDFLNGFPRAQSLYLGCIRHIFNEAIKEYNINGIKNIPDNPFDTFTIPKDHPKTKDRVISEENLIKVFNFKGTNRIGLARDCYILSFCLIGMNSVDMYECFSYKNGVLSYNRAKTRDRRLDNAYIEIKVPDIIKPLMRKYKGNSRVFDFYKRYANASNFNKNINIGLHSIADILGIPHFDFYSARHTWASIARNKLDIDKYTIHEALNHVSDLDITDLYIQKDYTNINKANAKVIEYLKQLIKQAKE